MESIRPLLSGTSPFVLTFFISLAILAAFMALYMLMTPYQEMPLIRSGNTAAAVSMGGAIIGFAIPLGKAVAQSVSPAELAVWAAIGFVAQATAYGIAAMLMPQLRAAIADDAVASGILLAALAIAIGVLNAAAMTM
jgi:putative membrane protein